jgi:hypothetical protein
LPINGGRHAGDSLPKLGTICALTPQTALSPTSESYHHDDDDGDDDDDAASLRKSKAQSGCLASLNVTRKDREVVSTRRKEASAAIVAYILASQESTTSITESQSCTSGEAHHDL